jgi:hypothetical protein
MIKINLQGGDMKKIRFVVMVGALFLLWPAFSWAEFDLFNAEDYSVEFEGRYWKPRMSGTITLVDNGIGSEINPVDDLGMEATKGFGEGRLQVKFLEKNKFNFSYMDLKWTATKNVSKTIYFNGLTYPAGTQVESRLEAKTLKGGYEYDFLVGEHGFLGVTADVIFSDASMELNARSLNQDEIAQDNLILPLFGVNSRLVIVKWVSLSGKVSGLPMGSHGYFLDAEASLDLNPIKYLGISVGYRYLKAHLSYRDDKSNLTFDGPFASVKLRF